MTVPFERIGRGQVARLVYQVIGKNGPILNPQNIRYLPVDPADLASDRANAGLQMVSKIGVAVSAVNLAVSVANLGLTAMVLKEVRQIQRKVDTLLDWAAVADTKLDAIREGIARIETKVEENNLRHAIEHILRKATRDGVDLEELSRVAEEITKFSAACGGLEPGGSLGVQLSADIRDHLQGIYSVLRSVRGLVYEEHNRSVHGDPVRVLTMHPAFDYLGESWPEWRIAVLAFRAQQGAVPQNVADGVAESVWFASRQIEQWRALMEGSLREHISEPALTPFLRGSLPVTEAWLLKDSKQLSADRDRMARGKERAPYEVDGDRLREKLERYALWWLYKTDAGLLLRTRREAEAIQAGYPKRFPAPAFARLPERSLAETIDVDVLLDAAALVGLPD